MCSKTHFSTYPDVEVGDSSSPRCKHLAISSLCQQSSTLSFKVYSTDSRLQHSSTRAIHIMISRDAALSLSHTHAYKWGPLMRYHFVIYHAVLQDVSPLPKHQQPPQHRPCLVLPLRLHTSERSNKHITDTGGLESHFINARKKLCFFI